MTHHILVVLKGFPRLSETFILQELLALEAAGFKLTLYALKGARENLAHEELKLLQAQVIYHDESVDLAQVLPTISAVDLVYAHFLHDPAEVGLRFAEILERPLVVSGHAVDIFTTPKERLAPVIVGARQVFVCHPSAKGFLNQLFPAAAAKIKLLPHGVNTQKFSFHLNERERAHLLLVGRLVPKKGFKHILQQLESVASEGIHFRVSVIGAGEEREQLEKFVKASILKERVRFLGALNHSELLPYYQTAGVLIMAPQTLANGDRDGIPNVLLEAMASGLPVLSSHHMGLEEILIPGKTARVFAAGEFKTELLQYLNLAPDELQQQQLQARELMVQQYDSQLHLARLIHQLRSELS